MGGSVREEDDERIAGVGSRLGNGGDGTEGSEGGRGGQVRDPDARAGGGRDSLSDPSLRRFHVDMVGGLGLRAPLLSVKPPLKTIEVRAMRLGRTWASAKSRRKRDEPLLDRLGLGRDGTSGTVELLRRREETR